MTDKELSTDSYKGVRDFYPEDAAIQQYIFNTWSKTAESFGFERYDASILEPADLYKSKGAENEELVNEQTYTFIDRGDREVTLRPEMTPTVARMVAAKARELSFPLRWYSIPNLFRYERPQKGRLREHWQLNCDIFGSDDVSADVEIIALAYQTLINFGAKPEQFEIRVNHRTFLRELLKRNDVSDFVLATRLVDRIDKLEEEEFKKLLAELVPADKVDTLYTELTSADENLLNSFKDNINLMKVINGLRELGINRVHFSPSLARGFDYYTGTIFEIFEVDDSGNATGRAMLGGGRYDNLTSMFGGEPISGIGFGMGDVTMRDFLEKHNLLKGFIKHTDLALLPENESQNIEAMKIAKNFRELGISCYVDISSKKINKKIDSLRNKKVNSYIEINDSGVLKLKSKHDFGKNIIGNIEELAKEIKNQIGFSVLTQDL